MLESIEKAYYLSKKEFLLLLGLAHIGEIYSFAFLEKQNFEKEDFTLVLHQLIKRKYVSMDPNPMLVSAIGEILETVQMADRVLVITPGEEGEQKICYLTDAEVVISELTGLSAELRLRKISQTEFLKGLFERTGVSARPLETEKDGKQLERFNIQMQEERIRYSEREVSENEIQSTWELLHSRQRTSLMCLQFIKGCINSWVRIKESEQCCLRYDSMEFRDELKTKICGKEVKGR